MKLGLASAWIRDYAGTTDATGMDTYTYAAKGLVDGTKLGPH